MPRRLICCPLLQCGNRTGIYCEQKDHCSCYEQSLTHIFFNAKIIEVSNDSSVITTPADLNDKQERDPAGSNFGWKSVIE